MNGWKALTGRRSPLLRRCPYCGLKGLTDFVFEAKISTTRLFCLECHRLTDIRGRKRPMLKARPIPPPCER
jgi:hypothetical protein